MLFVVVLLLPARFLSQSDFDLRFCCAPWACASTSSGLFSDCAKELLDVYSAVPNLFGLLAPWARARPSPGLFVDCASCSLVFSISVPSFLGRFFCFYLVSLGFSACVAVVAICVVDVVGTMRAQSEGFVICPLLQLTALGESYPPLSHSVNYVHEVSLI